MFRQTIGLGGGTERLPDAPNQVARTVDKNRLTLSLGRFSLGDFFDGNAYTHDAHTQFLGWGLIGSGAWDYPADTRGYTWGLVADLRYGRFSVRYGLALEPVYANLLALEWHIEKSRGMVLELETRYEIGARPGVVRALGFLNDARMGSYSAALAAFAAGRVPRPDVTASRAYGRLKGGFAVSAEQELLSWLGIFARVSFNDGQNETWAYTEIDQSLAIGALLKGQRWRRPDDTVGAALVVSGLSDVHRRYLAAGGYGFIIGDGRLRYAPELVGELFYQAQLTGYVALSAHYQPIGNPGYNQDRGPVHVLTLRAHAAY
jgi:high affinity Mn2+ porin